jgi:hypothetical protein
VRRLLAPLLLVAAAACGNGGGSASGSAAAGTGAGSGGGGAPATTTLHPQATPLPGETSCTVVETTGIPEPSFDHVTPCTPVAYATNPPSGGDHWPIWAAFKIYTTPVPREMYVHDLEHGAVVLAYRCAGACPDVVSALTMVFDGMSDPECLALMGPAARMVLTPDPDLSTPIAAASWGATYTATCIDVPSLQAFVKAHYGQGREDFCSDGLDVEAMPLCPDGGG